MADGAEEMALLVGMPLRHLLDAEEVCRVHGRVTLPAGGPGDLDRAVTDAPVYLMASDAGEEEIPAATWTAILGGLLDPSVKPELLPRSWVAEREHRAPTPPEAVPVSPFGDDDDEEDAGPPPTLGPVYFDVRGLRRLAKDEWIFTNELVPKQERGGRTFFPRQPRLIRVPD